MMERRDAVVGPRRDNVCVIVVTYHPDEDFPQRLEQMASLGDAIVCVDNGSTEPEIAMVSSVLSNVGGVLIRNNENLGVATALNRGLSHATKTGYVWVLSFDQDTIPFTEMFDRLSDIFESHPMKEKVAVIGSNYLYDCGKPAAIPFSDRDGGWREMRTVITAGSLVSLPLLEVIGPMRDSFFIDHVDHEFCLRVRAHGLKVIISAKPLMLQSIGAPKVHGVFPGLSIKASNHSAIRRYYMIRNYLGIARGYLFREPLFLLWNLRGQIVSLIAVILFETDKGPKLLMALRGLRDGVRGRFGKYGSG